MAHTDGLRRTPLYGAHVARGAKMGAVGAWDMPMWYGAGAVAEHRAVVDAGGLFDTSHMTTLLLSGDGARDFLQRAFTRDLAGLAPGRVGYGAFLDERGCVVDDATVYPHDETRWAVVANAATAKTLPAHLRSLPGGDALDLRTLSEGLVKIDVQGPRSVRVLGRLLDDPGVLDAFPYFSFKGDFETARSSVTLDGGTPAAISRSGYTGEVGFELYVPRERGARLWARLLEAGAEEGLLPCGYAARDSLRAGAVLPLAGQDVGAWPFIRHPWPWALPLGGDGGFTKDFHGAAALSAARATAAHTLPFAGFDPRKVETHGEPARVWVDGREAGVVLTAVADMSIGRVDGRIVGTASADKPEGWAPRGLVCGFVKVARALPAGTEVELRDARRGVKAEIVADIRPARTARRNLRDFL